MVAKPKAVCAATGAAKGVSKDAKPTKAAEEASSPNGRRRFSKADLQEFDVATIPSPDNPAAFKLFKVPCIRLKLQVIKAWAKKKGVKVGKEHINKFFETSDKAKLWQIFLEKRKKSDNGEAKEAYDTLAETKGVSPQKKRIVSESSVRQRLGRMGRYHGDDNPHVANRPQKTA